MRSQIVGLGSSSDARPSRWGMGTVSDWPSAYATWDHQFQKAAAGTSLTSFQQVDLHDPAYPTGRHQQLVWWPRDRITKRHTDYQKFYLDHPGLLGPPYEEGLPKVGVAQTLAALWRVQNNAELTAAILILASLFPRLYSTRSRDLTRHLPGRHNWKFIASLSHARLAVAGYETGWHYSCTQVLPGTPSSRLGDLTQTSAVIRGLADEQIAALEVWAPVVLVFKPAVCPTIDTVIREHRRKQASYVAKMNRIDERQRDERAQREADMRTRHPRYGEWGSLPDAELQCLVHTMPTTKVAALFGISDVAVAKRCRTHGIAKPPRGYWRKVETGARAFGPPPKPLVPDRSGRV